MNPQPSSFHRLARLSTRSPTALKPTTTFTTSPPLPRQRRPATVTSRPPRYRSTQRRSVNGNHAPGISRFTPTINLPETATAKNDSDKANANDNINTNDTTIPTPPRFPLIHQIPGYRIGTDILHVPRISRLLFSSSSSWSDEQSEQREQSEESESETSEGHVKVREKFLRKFLRREEIEELREMLFSGGDDGDAGAGAGAGVKKVTCGDGRGSDEWGWSVERRKKKRVAEWVGGRWAAKEATIKAVKPPFSPFSSAPHASIQPKSTDTTTNTTSNRTNPTFSKITPTQISIRHSPTTKEVYALLHLPSTSISSISSTSEIPDNRKFRYILTTPNNVENMSKTGNDITSDPEDEEVAEVDSRKGYGREHEEVRGVRRGGEPEKQKENQKIVRHLISWARWRRWKLKGDRRVKRACVYGEEEFTRIQAYKKQQHPPSAQAPKPTALLHKSVSVGIRHKPPKIPKRQSAETSENLDSANAAEAYAKEKSTST
ncbi:MAG: hypothetical protein M1831_004876 [Alyxoria varia]|nr:MAG: hypothetical protein M1831_004876 [Alyxoria varia]